MNQSQTSQAPPAAPQAGSRATRWLSRAAAVVLAVVLFGVSFYLCTRNNDFPIHWHPDEPSKVRQILSQTGDRNYNHPQLLLEATDWLKKKSATPDDPQEVVVVGRRASAFFAAVAVVALALVGYRSAGLVGMLIVGVAAGLCPSLMIYAHYMKEDSALVMGVALTALACRTGWDCRRWWSSLLCALCMGAACGVATSGKYVGIMTVAAALPVLAMSRPLQWYWPLMRTIVFMIALVGSVGIINHRVFDDWEGFKKSLQTETEHGMTEHNGLTMHRPNAFFIRAFVQETHPHIIALGAVGIVLIPLTWRRRSGGDLVLLFMFLVCFAVISWSVIPFNRYILPCVVLGYLLGGLGLAWLAQRATRGHWQIAATAGAVLLLFALQWPRYSSYLRQLKDDNREQLRQWVMKNAPRGSTIVADMYAGLMPGVQQGSYGDSPEWRSDLTIHAPFYAADTMNSRYGWNASYAIVCDLAYARFFSPHVFPTEDDRESYTRRKEWYEQIMRDGKLVKHFKSDCPTRAYTSPELRVYELKK